MVVFAPARAKSSGSRRRFPEPVPVGGSPIGWEPVPEPVPVPVPPLFPLTGTAGTAPPVPVSPPPPYGNSLSGNTFKAKQLVCCLSHGEQVQASDDGLLAPADRESHGLLRHPLWIRHEVAGDLRIERVDLGADRERVSAAAAGTRRAVSVRVQVDDAVFHVGISRRDAFPASVDRTSSVAAVPSAAQCR